MSGGRGLLWICLCLLIFAVAVWTEDTPNSERGDTTTSSNPPKAKVMPVEDSVQGHTIVDHYRWLEDSKDPEAPRTVADHWQHRRATDRRQVLLFHSSGRDAEPTRSLRSRQPRGQRPGSGRCEPVGGRRNYRTRLVVPLRRRQVCCLWDFSG